MNYVQERIARIKLDIQQTQDSANSETKNTAGDKHETGRAMAQLEVEKNSKQLLEAEKLVRILEQIDPNGFSKTIATGSLVTTDKGTFYISISTKAWAYEQKEYFFIAPNSPIGALFVGKSIGDKIVWNNNTYIILAIE